MTRKEKQLALTGCSLALGTLLPVALYQTRAICRLPDPPSELFDSPTIVSSRAAHPLGVPDGLLGLASYSATLALLLTANTSKPARRLLGLKLAADAGAAAFNVVRQVVRFRKLCSWCTGTALATGVMVYGGHRAIVSAVQDLRRAL